MKEAKSCGVYDEFVVNDELDRAIEQALSVVRARRG